MKTFSILQIATVLLTGLLAGLFYGYACSVNKALGSLPGKEYLSAFKAINQAIQNPVFFLSFMGSIIALIITTVYSYKLHQGAAFYLLLLALIIYAVGVFGVTVLGNIPLNERLAAFPVTTASDDEIARMRKVFENPWNAYHNVRTLAAVVSFCLTIISMIKK